MNKADETLTPVKSKDSEKLILKKSTEIHATFDIIEEDWDLHKLDNGEILRSRVMLTGVLFEKSINELEEQVKFGKKPKFGLTSVSYTHLTLPTILLV